ncbi:lethal (2) 05287 [Carabus blaptoides fortunei]
MEENSEISVKCKGGGSIINLAPVFSPDGQYIFVAWKNLVRSYSVETGERVADYEGCDQNIVGFAIHPTNLKLLVACTTSAEIAVWKWQAQLLISKNKLMCNINEVHSCHMLTVNDAENECELLISWYESGKCNMATFSFTTLKLKRSIPLGFKQLPLAINLGGQLNNQFMATIDQTKMFCYAFAGANKTVKCRTTRDTAFTCVACHPDQHSVATGDCTGRVIVWYGLFTGTAPIQTVYHWHTLPVNVVSFSQSGTVLYSGADECVLVKWRLDNLHKEFLPRLPASIKQIACAKANVTLAIAVNNNAVHLVDAQFRVKQVIQHLTWSMTACAGMKVDPRTRALVLNGYVGNLQFYSPRTMSLLYNLDIVGQNKLTRERETDIPNTNVTKIALSKSGDWLACVEERHDTETISEIRLKFFHFSDVDQTFSLNTSVELPHELGVNGLEFQPVATTEELLCATTGNDGLFKIWNLVDTTDIYRKSKAWRCASTGYYKNLSTNALAFSSDGSLLAVAFEACLTAWSPDTCDMKCSLVHPSFRAPLRIVQFGNMDNCHLVVTATSDRISVWNLLTLALTWTVPVQLTQLVSDPGSKYMAAFTSENSLFVFTPESSCPHFYKNHLATQKETITSTVFVPHRSERTTGPLWQRQSLLYFVNSNQELMCLDTQEEHSADTALEYSSHPRRSAFDALLAETVTTAPKTNTQSTHMDTGLSGATEIKQLIEPPIHTMAPMRLLCSSVLRSLILRDAPINDTVTETVTDEIVEEEQTESDTESADEIKRSTPKIPSLKSTKRETQKRTDDLKSVFKESLDWTRTLVD